MFVGGGGVISIFRHVCARGGGGGWCNIYILTRVCSWGDVISIFRHVCVRGGGGEM